MASRSTIVRFGMAKATSLQETMDTRAGAIIF